MAISGVSSSTSMYQMNQNSPLTMIKEDFDKLGKALRSGNISDIKEALAQLQKGLSTKTGSGINQMSSNIASLSETLNSGDIKAAQQEYSKIQEKMSLGRPVRGGENGGANKAPDSSAVSASNQKVYDKRVNSESQAAAQNTAAIISSSNPVSNPLLGALVNTMV